MSNNYEEGEINEELELFNRNQNGSQEEEEWDDSQLIKEYDRAVAKAKKQVLKKLQSEMGLSNEEIKDVFSEVSDTSVKKKNKKKKNKSKKTETKWTVGSACRAVYSLDGLEYEAEIVEIVEPNDCFVKFVGYDNIGEVKLSDLRPSNGKDAIFDQIVAANHDKAFMQELLNMPNGENYYSDSQSNQSINHIKLQKKGSKGNIRSQKMFNSFRRPPMDRLPFLPPPPPPPPTTMNPSRHFMEDESLNSMLMSWYMCGYYTGYYQRVMKD